MVFTCFLAIARQREGFDMIPASRAPAFPSVVRARQTPLSANRVETVPCRKLV